jgi:signal transduction histidine kinase
VISARTRVGELASLLLLAFAVDASVSMWRRGSSADRRRAVIVGGSVVAFVLVGAGHVALIHAKLITAPYMVSIAFLVPVVAMGYQLGADVVRASQLARDLDRSREQLRENEQRMDLAVTGAGLGLWRWDIARGDVWASEKGRELLGLNDNASMGLDDLLAALVPEDGTAVRNAVAQSLDGGQDYEGECRVLLPDGATRWLFSRGRVERNGGSQPVFMRGVCFDITSRKEAERDRARQRNELAHLSRVAMLGELSGSFAHELTQPLTSILSNAQAAQQFLADGPAEIEEVRGILQDIVDEDRRAREVIGRLRLLFRKGEVQYEPLDLNDLVRDVIKLMNSELINHGVTVQTDLAPQLPNVRGDRVQLQQVLINLLVNASDAMGEDDIANRKLRVSTRLNQHDEAELAVADSGCGIPPEQIERVFEPFHTTKTKGMGLGLTVCRTIISAHGGRLHAENNSDRGACFHVSLPSIPSSYSIPARAS